jgi:hypothetical protein
MPFWKIVNVIMLASFYRINQGMEINVRYAGQITLVQGLRFLIGYLKYIGHVTFLKIQV